ncbi:MAG: GNAT family N-acetyltransferase [Bdellovibrionales bacterium]|nr:GNAT family N-acetyltransferase [Bdellovibrionales bacterium]
MDQIRVAEVPWDEANQVNLLVSEAFGYSPPHSYFDDFPVWSSRNVLRLGGYSGNELVSHVGIQFRNIKTAPAKTPVALIGAVATKESARGRGYGSALLRNALEKIDQAGCSWSFLWGSEHEFYSRFGFHLSGLQARARIADLFINNTGGDRIYDRFTDTENGTKNKVFSGYVKEILDEFLMRRTGIEFLAEDGAWLHRQTTVQWKHIENPFSFIGYERGLDLKGIVHEFGGNSSGIKSLLFHLLQENPEAQIIGSPEQLIDIGFSRGSWESEGLCLARPKDSSISWNQEFWISGLGAV